MTTTRRSASGLRSADRDAGPGSDPGDADPRDPFGLGGGLPGMPAGMPGMPPRRVRRQPARPDAHPARPDAQPGAAAPAAGPVNYDLAAQLAAPAPGSHHAPRSPTPSAPPCGDAVKLAELWLDPATDVPRRRDGGRGLVGDRMGRRRACPPGSGCATRWRSACRPRGSRPCPRRSARRPARCSRCSARWAGSRSAASSGNGLAQLAAEVLSSTDIGIPSDRTGVAALLPENIEKFTAGPRPPRQRGA